MDMVSPYVKNSAFFVDLQLDEPKKSEFGFAFYRPVSFLHIEGISNAEEVPLVFQSSDLRWNATGDLSILGNRATRDGGNFVAFVDGHAKYKKPTWPEEPIEIKFKQ